MFRDEARILLRAGKGGDGKISFRREKKTPKGGPDGGDGGRGGDIVLRASDQINTLYDISCRPTYRAPAGGDGSGGNCHGSDGTPLVLEVPVGTLIRDAERGHLLKDLLRTGDEVRVVRGGKGGRGNLAFAGPTRQVPRIRELGAAGEEREVLLELRIVADVGLVGLPNAGKSTFLSRVSAARPKVASYPFTTVDPVLGVVALPGWRRMVLADLPGLIEGAHRGAGLGHRFLRHAGRTRVLLHLVAARPLSGPAPAEAWRTVRRELELHGGGISSRPEIVVLTKCDLPGWEEDAAELARACGTKVYPVSAVSGTGLREVLGETARIVQESVEPSQDPDGDLEERTERPAVDKTKGKPRSRKGGRPRGEG